MTNNASVTMALARRVWAESLVSVLAFVARLSVPLLGAGLFGAGNYDPSVYYAAADALTFGRVPYRDFVLLHPPVEPMLLTPFAALGRLTSDQVGFASANVAFMVLGAVNAVLVMRIVRRIGLGSTAALLGGLFYALWFGAVAPEHGIRLEPLGNFFLLLGLLAYFRGRTATTERIGRRAAVLSGVGLGLASAVKIWWVVPLFIVLGAYLVAGPASRRLALRYLAGAAGALIVACGPFFVLAPSEMFHMVVLDQLGRPVRGTAGTRIQEFAWLSLFRNHISTAVMVVILALLAAAFLVAVWRAWRLPPARLIVVLAAAQVLVLAFAPSFYGFYTDYTVPALALTLAAGFAAPAAGLAASRPLERRWPRWVAWVPVAAAVVITPPAAITLGPAASQPFPSATLAAAVRGEHCVMADEPMALIQLNALSRDFAHGCRNWVDVTGRTYGADKVPGVRRRHNLKWQHDLLDYLRSGDAVVTLRNWTGMSKQTERILHSGGVLARAGGYVVYLVPHPGAATPTARS